MANTILDSYLQQDPSVVKLLGGDFADPASHSRAVLPKTISAEVLRAIQETNADSPLSASQSANLELLHKPGTAVAVTGQQVGLCLGPLYTFYKALAVIETARQLSAESHSPVVPIFWLQSEDHNFSEISSVTIPDAEGSARTLSLAGESSETSHVSAKYKLLDVSVVPVLEELQGALGHFSFSAPLLELLSKYYQPGVTFVDAFRQTLNALFRNDGLLFLDPRTKTLAPLLTPIYLRVINQGSEVESILRGAVTQINALGFSEQVKVLEGSPLCFVHPESPGGPRYRVQSSTSNAGQLNYIGREGSISLSELTALAERNPLQLSSSALLRPVIQNCLLPVAAQIAGPSELAYLAEITGLYKFFGAAEPVIVPRPQFACVEPKVRKFLESAQLSAAQVLTLSEAELNKIAAANISEPSDSPEAVQQHAKEQLTKLFGYLKEKLSAADQTLSGSVEKTEQKTQEQLATLMARYSKAVANRDSVGAERLEKAKALLKPGGKDQERVFSALYFLSRYGTEYFKQAVRANLKPLSREAAGRQILVELENQQ